MASKKHRRDDDFDGPAGKRHHYSNHGGSYGAPFPPTQRNFASNNGPKSSHGASDRKTKPWPTRNDLDAKYPSTGTNAPIQIRTHVKGSPLPQYHGPPDLPPASEQYTRQAFTHSSVAHAAEDQTYEKLEFLGDAFIEMFSTMLIHTRFAMLAAGQQAQLRESLVNNENLADFADLYGFGARIHSAGPIFDRKDRGPVKILADVFEAYVAAVVLSDPVNGYTTAEAWLTALWIPQLLAFKPEVKPSDDAKIKLQTLLVSKGVALDYKEEKPMQLRDHGQQRYFMAVYLTGWGYEGAFLGRGDAQSKVVARTLAAEDALERSRELIGDANAKKVEADRKRKEEQMAKERA